MNPADMRLDYRLATLDEAAIDPDPIRQFSLWFDEATAASLPEPNAMTLATATKDGRPSARIVLLKGFDRRGFQFFSNYRSRKGRELEENPFASLVFFWPDLQRQVRIEGMVTLLPEAESDSYFQSRPAGSRLGAWASEQSEVVTDRGVFESRLQALEHEHPDGQIDRPDHWGGYVVEPESIEFWQGRSSRLHDRLRYVLEPVGSWRVERLSP